MFHWRFVTAAANEAVRAYQQLTCDSSLAGAASADCRILGDCYLMGGEL